MHLSDFDLKQVDKETISHLTHEQIMAFSVRLLEDLKEARERLNQNSNNSSKPPSSNPPWIGTGKDNKKGDEKSDPESIEAESSENIITTPDIEPEPKSEPKSESESESDLPTSDGSSTSSSKDTSNRKAGKQHGAQGYGRTQELIAHAFERHAPERCAICDAQLVVSDDCKAWTGWLSVDIAARSSGLLGITFFNTHHLMLSITCSCGHENRAEPYKAPADDAWPGTEISEWRLVGSRLAAMIVLLSQRHYQSRARIKEFLLTFTGLELSIGTIDKTIREAGRSVEPLEDELVRDIEQAALLHADETSWKESGKTLWLWVFVCSTTILFRIGGRGRELFAELLLNGRFKGALMTDGWKVYREYLNRLRCWAHLDRKIKGLTESLNKNVEHVGLEIKALFDTLKIAIYEARSQVGPPKMGLEIRYAAEIETLRQLCLSHKDSRHDKLKAFSREMLNDWDVIMRQVREPWMPLTNNDAERVLRPCVIGRRLSNGTRKAQGTRSFGLLASVIETSRRREAQTWEFLTSVIDAARKGLAIPSMPLMGV